MFLVPFEGHEYITDSYLSICSLFNDAALIRRSHRRQKVFGIFFINFVVLPILLVVKMRNLWSSVLDIGVVR